MATRKAKSTHLSAVKKKATAKRARGKLAPGKKARGIDAADVAIGLDSPDVVELAAVVRDAGGAPIGAYREPLGGLPLMLASLPLSAVQPTPFQRDLSPTHAKRLAQKIDETAAFLDPLIVVRGEDGRFWTPNGRHRLAAGKVLGLKQITALISPNDRLAWSTSSYVKKTAQLEAKRAFLGKLVKAMADAGVELVAGTDAPAVPGLLPGYALHDDLCALEGAGLSRYQALSAATRAPGDFIHRSKGGQPFGVVAPGYRADLVLSTANPLDDLATLRNPAGVMVHGQWRDAAALKDLLDGVRESYRHAAAMP